MPFERIALIGHSAAGKTSTLLLLGIDNALGDMDQALGVHRPPPWTEALDWLLDRSRPPVVSVSNHRSVLMDFRRAKSEPDAMEPFGRIFFIYLHKPLDRLRRHFIQPYPNGWRRPRQLEQPMVDTYAGLHEVYAGLADSQIDCSSATVPEVAAKVRAQAVSLSIPGLGEA